MSEYRAARLRLKQLGQRLTTDDRATLREAHETLGWSCSAHSEGQDCCADYILGDYTEESYPNG